MPWQSGPFNPEVEEYSVQNQYSLLCGVSITELLEELKEFFKSSGRESYTSQIPSLEDIKAGLVNKPVFRFKLTYKAKDAWQMTYSPDYWPDDARGDTVVEKFSITLSSVPAGWWA